MYYGLGTIWFPWDGRVRVILPVMQNVVFNLKTGVVADGW